MITSHIEIIGKIKAKERPRFNRHTGRVFTPSATSDSEKTLGWVFKSKHPYVEPTALPVCLTIEIYIPVPKKYRKLNLLPLLNSRLYPTGKPDIDNIQKTIMDSMNGLLYYDDSQVVNVNIQKRYNINDMDEYRTLVRWDIITTANPITIPKKFRSK